MKKNYIVVVVFETTGLHIEWYDRCVDAVDAAAKWADDPEVIFADWRHV